MKKNGSNPNNGRTMVRGWVEKQSIIKRHNNKQQQCVYEVSMDISPLKDDFFH